MTLITIVKSGKHTNSMIKKQNTEYLNSLYFNITTILEEHISGTRSFISIVFITNATKIRLQKQSLRQCHSIDKILAQVPLLVSVVLLVKF